MKELIENTVSDLVGCLLYEDRREDESLPVGAIERAITASEITVDDIVAHFKSELIERLQLE